jgi:hypothetical protein
VTVEPETLHTAAGDALKLMGNPEEAVALTGKGGAPTDVSGIVLKKIVWPATVILKL